MKISVVLVPDSETISHQGEHAIASAAKVNYFPLGGGRLEEFLRRRRISRRENLFRVYEGIGPLESDRLAFRKIVWDAKRHGQVAVVAPENPGAYLLSWLAWHQPHTGYQLEVFSA